MYHQYSSYSDPNQAQSAAGLSIQVGLVVRFLRRVLSAYIVFGVCRMSRV
jgi:hypothetical protein